LLVLSASAGSSGYHWTGGPTPHSGEVVW